jgi:NADH-quinone oxidoreductase subunit N
MTSQLAQIGALADLWQFLLLPILPILILAGTSLALLVVDMLVPDTRKRGLLTAVSTTGALLAVAVAGWFLLAGSGQAETGGAISLFQDQLVVDGMSLFFTILFGTVAALVSVASYDYVADQPYQSAYFSLVMMATTGMALMAAANSLAVAFIALELSSLPSYALVAYLKKNRGSVEAGLKYFLVGAVSSSILVYGISLVYGATGALQFESIAAGLGDARMAGLLGLGVLMLIGGFAFKTASVPFHFWAPEAYEGAPSPISGFISSASKAAGFALAFRVFTVALPSSAAPAIDWVVAFQVLAVVTMFLGNLAALTQEKVKRMLAYSSVGHAGYVLIALASLAPGAPNREIVLGAGIIHLLVYGVMNTGAFLFVAMAERWGIGREFEDYNGLATQAPIACVAMTVFLFSLAGVPLGGGFLSKLLLFFGAVKAGFWWLALIGVINSTLSVYYYARVLKAMWIEDPDEDLAITSRPTGLYAAVLAAAVLTVLLLPVGGLIAGDVTAAAQELLNTGIQAAAEGGAR